MESLKLNSGVLSGLAASLKLLNASRNRITDSGAYQVARLISRTGKLETLLLYWNKIRTKGSILISKALANNSTLKILDLSFNSMASGGVRRIAVGHDPSKEVDVMAEHRHKMT